MPEQTPTFASALADIANRIFAESKTQKKLSLTEAPLVLRDDALRLSIGRAERRGKQPAGALLPLKLHFQKAGGASGVPGGEPSIILILEKQGVGEPQLVDLTYALQERFSGHAIARFPGALRWHIGNVPPEDYERLVQAVHDALVPKP